MTARIQGCSIPSTYSMGHLKQNVLNHFLMITPDQTDGIKDIKRDLLFLAKQEQSSNFLDYCMDRLFGDVGENTPISEKDNVRFRMGIVFDCIDENNLPYKLLVYRSMYYFLSDQKDKILEMKANHPDLKEIIQAYPTFGKPLLTHILNELRRIFS